MLSALGASVHRSRVPGRGQSRGYFKCAGVFRRCVRHNRCCSRICRCVRHSCWWSALHVHQYIGRDRKRGRGRSRGLFRGAGAFRRCVRHCSRGICRCVRHSCRGGRIVSCCLRHRRVFGRVRANDCGRIFSCVHDRIGSGRVFCWVAHSRRGGRVIGLTGRVSRCGVFGCLGVDLRFIGRRRCFSRSRICVMRTWKQ